MREVFGVFFSFKLIFHFFFSFSKNVFSSLLLSLSGNNLYLFFFFTRVICILLLFIFFYWSKFSFKFFEVFFQFPWYCILEWSKNFRPSFCKLIWFWFNLHVDIQIELRFVVGWILWYINYRKLFRGMLQDEILPWFEKTKRKEKRRKEKKKNGSYHFEFSTQNEKLVVHASAPRRTSVCDKLTKKKKNTLINIQSERFPRGTKIAVREPTKYI